MINNLWNLVSITLERKFLQKRLFRVADLLVDSNLWTLLNKPYSQVKWWRQWTFCRLGIFLSILQNFSGKHSINHFWTAAPPFGYFFDILSGTYSETCQSSKMELFAKQSLNYFCKKLYIRCLIGFWIRLWLYTATKCSHHEILKR